MKDIISKRTRTLFREYLVEYSVLREIKDYFDNHNLKKGYVPLNEFSGERRSLVEEYYSPIIWNNIQAIQNIKNVFEEILIDLEFKANSSDVNYYQIYKLKYNEILSFLERDGFIFKDNKLVYISRDGDKNIIVFNDLLNDGTFKVYTERIKSSIDTDPSLAIGSTKELIEATLKTILDEKKVMYERYDDIPKLLKQVQTVLNLVPKDVKSEKKGSEYIKAILSSLGQITIKTAELRNLYGSGHGDSKTDKGLSKRHAKLVVGSGITLVTFLLDTLEMQREANN